MAGGTEEKAKREAEEKAKQEAEEKKKQMEAKSQAEEGASGKPEKKKSGEGKSQANGGRANKSENPHGKHPSKADKSGDNKQAHAGENENLFGIIGFLSKALKATFSMASPYFY